MWAHTRRAGRKHEPGTPRACTAPPRWARGRPSVGRTQRDPARSRGQGGQQELSPALTAPRFRPSDRAGSHGSRKAPESHATSPTAEGRGAGTVHPRPEHTATHTHTRTHTGEPEDAAGMLAGLGRARESSRRQRAALPTPRGRGRQARPGQWAGSLGPALPSTGFLEPVGAFSFASRRPRLLSGRLSGLGVSVFLSLLLALYDMTTKEPGRPQERVRIQTRVAGLGVAGGRA